MNLNRLERLILVLESVEAAGKAFDLTRWIAPRDEVERYGTTTGSFDGEACGTACCALGYAALDPQFREEGLRLGAWIWNDRKREYTEHDLATPAIFNATIVGLHEAGKHFNIAPVFDGREDFEAGAKFFGIDENAAHYLFDPEEYEDGEDRPIPPAEVIARVREVIAHDGACPPRQDDAA